MNKLEISNIIFQEKYSINFPNEYETDERCIGNILGFIYRKKIKNYLIKCNICSNDHELHGAGIYLLSTSNLNKEQISCGCSIKPSLSKYQYSVRIKRLCTNELKFTDFENFNGSNSICIFECINHGLVKINLNRFLNNGVRCKYCAICKNAEKHKINDENHITDFMNTGVFIEGTIFCRSERKDSYGYKKFWCYKCPICSYDEYVQAGLCTGIFEGYITSLKRGIVSCRCTSNFRWTQKQREYQLRKKFIEDNHGYNFIRWKENNGYDDALSKCVLKCPNNNHLEYESSFNDTFNNSRGCPECKGYNQKQCYINVIKENNDIIALKYGISNNSEVRLQHQKRYSIYYIENLGTWEYNDTQSCKDAERECKKLFGEGIILKENMKDGYTETTEYSNLQKIIEIYEKFGGKLIQQ